MYKHYKKNIKSHNYKSKKSLINLYGKNLKHLMPIHLYNKTLKHIKNKRKTNKPI